MAKGQQLAIKDFSHVKSIDEFADLIGAAWHRAIGSIVEAGMLCERARRTLERGELKELKRKLKMSDSAFSKLRKIARDPRITAKKNWPHLPSSYATLYELTQLTDKQFKSAIDEGVLRPETERGAVIAIRSQGSSSSKKSKPGGAKSRTILKITTEADTVSKDGAKALQEAVATLVRYKSINVEVSPLYKQLTSKPK